MVQHRTIHRCEHTCALFPAFLASIAKSDHRQFTPKVWDIAIDCVKRTLRTSRIPKHLITVHVRLPTSMTLLHPSADFFFLRDAAPTR